MNEVIKNESSVGWGWVEIVDDPLLNFLNIDFTLKRSILSTLFFSDSLHHFIHINFLES